MSLFLRERRAQPPRLQVQCTASGTNVFINICAACSGIRAGFEVVCVRTFTILQVLCFPSNMLISPAKDTASWSGLTGCSHSSEPQQAVACRLTCFSSKPFHIFQMPSAGTRCLEWWFGMLPLSIAPPTGALLTAWPHASSWHGRPLLPAWHFMPPVCLTTRRASL